MNEKIMRESEEMILFLTGKNSHRDQQNNGKYGLMK